MFFQKSAHASGLPAHLFLGNFVSSDPLKYLAFILLFVTGAAYAQTDSLRSRLPEMPDTVLDKANLKLDSIEQSFSIKSDSIKQSYLHQKEKLTGIKSGYQHKVDSLGTLNLPTAQYMHKVDSMDQRLADVQQKAVSKIDSLKDRVNSQVIRLKLPKEANGKVARLTGVMDKVNVPAFDTDITNKIGLDKVSSALPDLPGASNLPSVNLPGGSPDLSGSTVKMPDVNSNIPPADINSGKIGEITGQAGDIQKQVAEASGSAEGLGKTLESKAGDQVKGLPEQKMPEVAGMPGGIPKTGDDAKEQLTNMAKQEAVNHFAGKEAALTGAMEKMSKYKQKYSSVNSLKDIQDEKRHNEMKGKPLIERLVPAVTLQFQSWRDLMLDVNPSLGYRFTSHIIGGLGWNQRVAFNIPGRQFNAAARVFGFRSYGEYSLKKGFGFRLDLECMNTPLKQKNLMSDISPGRDWVWSALVGVKQKYPIYKKLKGNAQLMYNVFDRDHRSPYTDRVNFRIGIELTLKKKKKAEQPAPVK